MSRLQHLAIWILGLGFLLLAMGTNGARSSVNWRSVRAVALESDDWGLAGFVPHADSWQGLAREDLKPGRFPAVYWQSTLEDADVINQMVQVLTAQRGRDGLPAVFQANYVMRSLGWDDRQNRWVEYKLPNWPPEYARPRMWAAVQRARELGVWQPELHASLHYDPARRLEHAFDTEIASEATRRGISLFPDSEGARELAPWRPLAEMTAELDSSLVVFERAFEQPVNSVIAPDYTWHNQIEDMWLSRGLTVIQAKREQRNPQWIKGKAGRIQKYVDRQWARLIHQDRVYLERNCRLEPVQASDPAAIVAQCVSDTYAAWQRGEPAIVETHRVNFSHTDPAVVATGVQSLAEYLARICAGPVAPVFLCDSEIAQLSRRGTSWRVAGNQLILRNATLSSRVVVVPARVRDLFGSGSGPIFIRLGAGEVRVIRGEDLS